MKKITCLALILLLPIFVSGCAGHGRDKMVGVWIKDGASEGDYIQAHSECMARAKAENKTQLLFDPNLLMGCMQGKGWQYEKR